MKASVLIVVSLSLATSMAYPAAFQNRPRSDIWDELLTEMADAGVSITRCIGREIRYPVAARAAATKLQTQLVSAAGMKKIKLEEPSLALYGVGTIINEAHVEELIENMKETIYDLNQACREPY